ncbi:apolipoprotein N-acyltransferase [Canibacter sp. lx-45]|uniref:apolipoprotein N-acyltransferase n=1 Tax=Canibacter zhuwentaonis TaxID=2837491 RepID=UPI001BDCFBFB|nr:apolipoprotein N-acyltransferase [Canibacter zhuwentaonis]MBT1035024.1 apolipoprotein N-acyltransferase [Canibacter zhuwentaonis]
MVKKRLFLLRIAAASGAGLMLDAAMPDIGIWYLGIPALTIFTLSFWGLKPVAAALIGSVFGASFWLAHIEWLTFYLGIVPWLALSSVMIAWTVLFAAAATFTVNSLPRISLLHNRHALISAQTLSVTGLWVVRETLASSIPYGGFAWARTSAVLLESPFAKLVSYLGITGCTALVTLVAVLPVAAWHCHRKGAAKRRSSSAAVLTALTATAVVCATLLLPKITLPHVGEPVRAGIVQGNVAAGIFDNRKNGDIIKAHLQEANTLLDNTQQQLDMIVFPENAAEYALIDNYRNRTRITELAKRAKAPVLAGAVLPNTAANGTDFYTNSALLIAESGQVVERYDKKYPVPFAEYMPHRDFFTKIAPELVKLINLEYTPGVTDSVMQIGSSTAGIAICYDMIYDNHQRLMLASGAEYVITQTNNADFGSADQAAQQLALARLQSLSTGRYTVAVSTRGPSGVIAPDTGKLTELIFWHESGGAVVELQRTTGITPAAQLGHIIAGFWICSGLLGLFLAGCASFMHSRKNKSTAP